MATFATCVVSVSSASATAGWQSLGNSYFYATSGSSCHTKHFSSGGGEIRIGYWRPGDTESIDDLKVWESDPNNPDDFIGTIRMMDGWAPKQINVGIFTDGDNGKAEIYIAGPCTGDPWVHIDD
ncbi:hypothetical protein [Streptomyces sp. NPDC060243]|uniref:hypothetical protein n=1 Tax=Streptomyces sp. NPDC060243 TaxID=3347081 RepID=UPI00364FC900